MHRIYWGAPLVQETRFWSTYKDKTSVLGQWKETVDEQWAAFQIHVHQPWRVALSVHIQVAIIPGEKMVVIHPGRRH